MRSRKLTVRKPHCLTNYWSIPTLAQRSHVSEVRLKARLGVQMERLKPAPYFMNTEMIRLAAPHKNPGLAGRRPFKKF